MRISDWSSDVCSSDLNARRIQALQAEHGSFAAWIAANHPLPKADWVKLFKKTFRFTGGEIVGEFLMSIGYLPGTDRKSVVSGKGVSVRVALGGRRIIKKKIIK